MKINFTDPILFICLGILLIGSAFAVWAMGKLRKSTTAPTTDTGDLDNDGLLSGADLGLDPLDNRPLAEPDLDPMKRPEPPAAKIEYKEARPQAAPAPAAAATKEVAERLESMTQRLTEMQALLNKQTAAVNNPSAAAGNVGQGFSPETIDKLLKIIGNVIQQVDVLQKAMNVTKEPAPALAPGIAVPAAPKTTVPMAAPAAKPIGTPPAPVPGPGVIKPSVVPPAGAPPKL